MTKNEWIQKTKALLFDLLYTDGALEDEIRELLTEGGGYDAAKGDTPDGPLHWPTVDVEYEYGIVLSICDDILRWFDEGWTPEEIKERVRRRAAVLRPPASTSLTMPDFEAIMSDDDLGGSRLREIGEEDNVVLGLNIIRKYLPTAGISGADHDVIYSMPAHALLEAGITAADARELRALNWMLSGSRLACFV